MKFKVEVFQKTGDVYAPVASYSGLHVVLSGERANVKKANGESASTLLSTSVSIISEEHIKIDGVLPDGFDGYWLLSDPSEF